MGVIFCKGFRRQGNQPVFPYSYFRCCGFEHCVAYMYYISAGLFSKNIPGYVAAAQIAGVNLDVITWKNFFITNLVPVTLGNIIGGSVCVGALYWYIYLREAKNKQYDNGRVLPCHLYYCQLPVLRV